jgi:hypothetical protein
MTQTLYAHMNNKRERKKKNKKLVLTFLRGWDRNGTQGLAPVPTFDGYKNVVLSYKYESSFIYVIFFLLCYFKIFYLRYIL